ncbi:MAG TPA: hypothetical protein VLB69_09020, partial [Rudaea sp.]|nr:hypothetical protein [Rudaea sp.]
MWTRLRRSSGPVAGKCSCICGIWAFQTPAEDAPSFVGVAGIYAPAEKCSCIFGMPAIHGHKKGPRQ